MRMLLEFTTSNWNVLDDLKYCWVLQGFQENEHILLRFYSCEVNGSMKIYKAFLNDI